MRWLRAGSLVVATLLATGVVVKDVRAQTDTPKEFKVYDNNGNFRQCGTFSRVDRDWHLTGCPSLFAVIAEDQCGNGTLDPGEVCDNSAPTSGCPQGTACVDCDSCVTGTPVPTPIPTPAPTPTGSFNEACPQGELPRLNIPGDTVWGLDWVPIGDGETHTYCFTLSTFSRKLQITIADRTGASQCTWNTIQYIPPPGSGLSTQTGVGRGSSYSFFNTNGLPMGVWRISITEAVTPDCADKYQITVHP